MHLNDERAPHAGPRATAAAHARPPAPAAAAPRPALRRSMPTTCTGPRPCFPPLSAANEPPHMKIVTPPMVQKQFFPTMPERLCGAPLAAPRRGRAKVKFPTSARPISDVTNRYEIRSSS
ncbi:hypothetical protein EVAR_20458_1 [Eumeta japonica]|uniref:Uncharacterized protein n=1 Tax=Eumeta variegata TaxID=151549 RepID=A0A4C1TZ94_EUMVA|nr:hypothetical protein EVAR_20458_1 [Eumeta japonica]